jgi:hypothetical protein
MGRKGETYLVSLRAVRVNVLAIIWPRRFPKVALRPIQVVAEEVRELPSAVVRENKRDSIPRY